MGTKIVALGYVSSSWTGCLDSFERGGQNSPNHIELSIPKGKFFILPQVGYNMFIF